MRVCNLYISDRKSTQCRIVSTVKSEREREKELSIKIERSDVLRLKKYIKATVCSLLACSEYNTEEIELFVTAIYTIRSTALLIALTIINH